MKNKIYLGIVSLVMGLLFASCTDNNDYTISTTPLLNDQSVVTGSSDVTATSAILHGSVTGLDKMAPSSYVMGFFYGFTQENLTESVTATIENGSFFSTLTELTNNSTLYYQAFVCLQGKVYYKGQVKSLVTTNATVVTKPAAAVDYASAVLGGTLTGYPSDVTCGIVISTSADVETVRSGLIVKSETLSDDFTFVRAGLLPNTHYYYAAYLNLGNGVIYGDVKDFTTAAYNFDLDNDLVDLGLSVKWARFNVGAKSESDLGGLFGFGDLTGCSTSINPADFASSDTYRTASDLAYQAFQGRATLPSAADFEELFSLCTKEWTQQDGVNGYKLTGPNGNSIFLPAAGSRIGSDVTGEGAEGYYLTGTVNPTNSQFAISYQFDASINTKTTTAVYQAMAVRAVSTAKNVPLDRSLLYTKWYLDNGQDGLQHVFQGPFTQWGETDNWATVSNGQPNIQQQIHWEMGTDNGWIGYTYGVDYGYMEFLEDGTVNVHRLTDDGTATDQTGKYTIDEVNKVIDIDIDVLCANTWVAVKSGKLNILSLTSDGLQIAIRNNDGYAYSLNYYSQRKADADAKFTLLPVDNSKVLVGDLEGKGNLRIEIFNAYGSTNADPGIVPTDLMFSSKMEVTFTLSGITFKDGAAGAYNGGLEFASGDWGVQYWAAADSPTPFDTNVKGNGTYTVYMNTNGATSNGATVFCIDIMQNIWNDIADTSTVGVTIDSIKLY